LLKPGASFSTTNQEGAARRRGQDRVDFGHAAVGDPLFAAGDVVAFERAVFVQHRHGLGFELRQVGAGLRFGGAVGDEQPFGGDAAHPVVLLFRRAAHDDGVGAEEGGEDAGGDAHVDAGHRFGNAVDVVGAAAQPLIVLADKDEMQTDVVVKIGKHFRGEAVFVVKFQQEFRRQFLLCIFVQGRENLVEFFAVKRHNRYLLRYKTTCNAIASELIHA
jgi:hypothetical protein